MVWAVEEGQWVGEVPTPVVEARWEEAPSCPARCRAEEGLGVGVGVGQDAVEAPGVPGLAGRGDPWAPTDLGQWARMAQDQWVRMEWRQWARMALDPWD